MPVILQALGFVLFLAFAIAVAWVFQIVAAKAVESDVDNWPERLTENRERRNRNLSVLRGDPLASLEEVTEDLDAFLDDSPTRRRRRS
jgi:hypothetical protein